MFPTGLLGFLGGYRRPAEGFPKGAALTQFLRDSQFGKRFRRRFAMDADDFNEWLVDHLVSDAVERYLQLHGVDARPDPVRRDRILRPMLVAASWRKKELRLVVPAAMTHFDVDHLRLSETTYLTRIPKRLQLARAQLKSPGSGAAAGVVGAATHAFVSEMWELDVETIPEVADALQHISTSASDTIEAFFGALRLGAGVRTGYAQALWVPKKWALRYSADLPPVYGTMVRQYPDDFDNYAWARAGERVTREQLEEVRTLYRLIEKNEDNRIRLAVKRLNTCMTRSDDADAVLDAAIGLEILLNDDENQALSYKLRLRAGALALIEPDPAISATDLAKTVNRVYGARSSIVHGKIAKKKKNAIDAGAGEHVAQRADATALLRFVLERLLKFPRYLEPKRIDE